MLSARNVFERPQLQLLAKESLQYFLSKTISALCGISVVIVLMVRLGSSSYGEFTLYWTIPLLVSNVCSTWIVQSILRFQSGHSPKNTSTIRSSAILTICVACASSGLILSLVHAGIEFSLWLNLSLLSGTMVFASVNLTLLQSQFQGAIYAFLSAGRAIMAYLLPAGLIFFWSTQWSYWPVIVLATIGNLIFGTWAAHLSRKSPELRRSNGWIEEEVFFKYLRFGLPLSAWMLLAMLIEYMDRFIVESMLGLGVAGTYAAVYDVVYKGTVFLLAPINMAAHPRIMSYANEGNKTGLRASQYSAIVAQIIIGLGIALMVLLLSHFAFDNTQTDMPDSLLILLLVTSGVVWQVAMLLHKTVEVLGKVIHLVGTITIAMLTNFTILLLFVPTHGILAAAFAMVISGVVYCISVVILNWITTPVTNGK